MTTAHIVAKWRHMLVVFAIVCGAGFALLFARPMARAEIWIEIGSWTTRGGQQLDLENPEALERRILSMIDHQGLGLPCTAKATNFDSRPRLTVTCNGTSAEQASQRTGRIVDTIIARHGALLDLRLSETRRRIALENEKIRVLDRMVAEANARGDDGENKAKPPKDILLRILNDPTASRESRATAASLLVQDERAAADASVQLAEARYELELAEQQLQWARPTAIVAQESGGRQGARRKYGLVIILASLVVAVFAGMAFAAADIMRENGRPKSHG